MVRSRSDVVEELHRRRRDLQALGVSRLGLFGSFVRDQSGPDSDVDLLVEFQPGRKSFDAFMELSEKLESWLSRQVELVTVESLSPRLGPHILREVEYVPLADGIPAAHTGRDRLRLRTDTRRDGGAIRGGRDMKTGHRAQSADHRRGGQADPQ